MKMPIAKVSPELAEGQPKNIAADPIELARELAKQFTETAAERDDQGATAWHERDLIRNSGLLRLIIPKSSGGFGWAWPTVMGVVRTIATADGSLAHVLGFHNLQLVTPHVLGSREQRNYYYEQTAKQNWFWGNAINPPQVSSIDPTRITGWKVVITPDGTDYRINGTNFYCSGATGSDILVISALKPGIDRLAESLVTGAIPTNREGVRLNNDWNNIGQRQTDSGSVTFENVLVRENELFLDPGLFRSTFATLRSCIAQLTLTNVYLGLAEGAFWTAKRFEHTLTQPWQNSGIADVTQDPYIVRHFGEFWVELEAARVLTNRAAESLQAAWELQEAVNPAQRGAVAIDIATAKIAATRAGLRITSEIFEVMGARATKAKDRFDRFWRNLRTLTLHDPVDYKVRDVGLWALSDQAPKPGFYS
jgi:alkylation response protein AidB-like acyl-CoA dehydrogenase